MYCRLMVMDDEGFRTRARGEKYGNPGREARLSCHATGRSFMVNDDWLPISMGPIAIAG